MKQIRKSFLFSNFKNNISKLTTTNELTNHSTTNDNNISDRRNSELPQNQLNELRDGNYVTNYNYDTNNTTGEDNSTSSGSSNSTNNTTNNTTDNNNYNETITRTPSDKIAIYKEFQENTNYNARIEARQNSMSGIPEMNSRTDTMFPVNNYLNTYTQFMPNELH